MDYIYKNLIYILLSMICAFAMSVEKTHYEILSVPPTASQEEITQAYNRLMNQTAWGDSATMTEIQTSYIILKDEHSRRLYDNQLRPIVQSASAEARQEWREESKQEFYDAYSTVVSEAYPQTKGFNLAFIAVAGFELSYEQVRNILTLVTRVKSEPNFVRVAALAALSRYVDQLMIGDIMLLILLSSSKNLVDDRHLSKKKIKKGVPSIKQMSREIVDQWLETKFEYSEPIDQIIEAVVDADNKYSFDTYKLFRKFILQKLKNNNRYVKKLTPEHIRALQRLSRQEKRHFFTIRNIVNQWNQLNRACPLTFQNSSH